MSEENLIIQNDELNALKSIFEKEFLVEEHDGSRLCTFTFEQRSGDETEVIVEGKLEMRLPVDYPSERPPSFELMCPRMNARHKAKLSARLQEIYLDHANQPILFMWIEAVRAKLVEIYGGVETCDSFSAGDEDEADSEAAGCAVQSHGNSYSKFSTNNNHSENGDIPEVVSGQQVTDRKSTFQAHLAAPVNSKDQVKRVLQHLLQNPKISRATHNIYAYRIQHDQSRDLILQDCEDDGEHHAGERLLHLLNKMNVLNALVVVTRWYGGIHLGNDRFRHINSVAKDLLEANGFGGQKQTTPNKPETGGKHTTNKRRSKH